MTILNSFQKYILLSKINLVGNIDIQQYVILLGRLLSCNLKNCVQKSGYLKGGYTYLLEYL